VRTFKLLLQNLAVLALFALALLAYGWWRSDPGIVDRALPVHYPQEPARGSLGEPVTAHGVTVLVTSFDRRRSTEGTAGLELSSRARIGSLVDFVIVNVEFRNDGSEPVSLDYYGSAQRADLLLGARRPVPPTVSLPLLPRDLESIGGLEPLPSRVLEPGETIAGSLIYPLNRHARDLAFAVLPAYFLTANGASVPSFEIDLGRVRR
jgi:hypothetical protein